MASLRYPAIFDDANASPSWIALTDDRERYCLEPPKEMHAVPTTKGTRAGLDAGILGGESIPRSAERGYTGLFGFEEIDVEGVEAVFVYGGIWAGSDGGCGDVSRAGEASGSGSGPGPGPGPSSAAHGVGGG